MLYPSIAAIHVSRSFEFLSALALSSWSSLRYCSCGIKHISSGYDPGTTERGRNKHIYVVLYVGDGGWPFPWYFHYSEYEFYLHVCFMRVFIDHQFHYHVFYQNYCSECDRRSTRRNEII